MTNRSDRRFPGAGRFVAPLVVAVSFVAVSLVVVALASCGGGSGAPSSASPSAPASPGPAGTPHVLAASHPGWKSQYCGSCHGLPVAGHQVSDQWRCAQCHGGNGACNPNARAEVRRHATGDDCLSCHQQRHQFTANPACVACHFAASGTVTCEGRAAPGLPGALQSGCFGWPATEFSPSNKASVSTRLRAGDVAVEFALRDTAGALVRLSDLIRSRPVLLVHGSFT